MPELPEVETIKKQLEKSIAGKTIKSVEIKNAVVLLQSTPPKKPFLRTELNDFKKRILNTRINSITRRAKLIIIKLSNGYDLLIHLGMSGHLLYIGKPINNSNKHNHIIYTFTDKSQLIHNDSRRIGYAEIIQKEKNYVDKKYGPEPLSKNFTLTLFSKILNKKPRAKIKQFLMDQKNIAGIGNLYADEILFFAGVLPTRKNFSLNNKEIKKIYGGITKILNKAIKFRGSSVENYVDANGKAGEYHLQLKVYGRGKLPCLKCKTLISKIKLGGRGTHFCSKCQK